MNFETWFETKHPEIPLRSAQAVIRLVSDGATLPFIARYRKEQTDKLDELGIQAVIDSHESWNTILKRQAHIVEEIERQKKLTPELKDQILATFEPELLEDLYLPYKQKRKTKAALAREAGLEPLADWIWNCGHGTEAPQPGQTLELWAFTFRNEEKGFDDAAAVIEGAQDILVERLSEKQELRKLVRETSFKDGHIRTSKGTKPKPHSKFEHYFSYSEPVSSLLQPQNSHRYLAARRGWVEEELSFTVGGKPDTDGGDGGFEQNLLAAFEAEALTDRESVGASALLKAARAAYKAHVQPSIDNEVHKALREVADEAAIHVFAENVRRLLLAAPFGPKAVLGVDPGIRTGCKLAVVDDSGKYIASTVIHLKTDEEKQTAAELVAGVVQTGGIRAVAVGNGTAGRETELFLRKALKERSLGEIPIIMVSEAGASVYSASEAAREEFPELDVTIRGAISIARRLQDPLSELVKIDPKSIGVGQYQHDVSESSLRKSLELVLDTCVNQVGVNLNTASYHLLSHVAGIGPALAKGIVEYRGATGLFRSRAQLLDVPRFGNNAFEQAAGFLRVPEAENPLDNTGVHPERYSVIEGRAQALKMSLRDLLGAGAQSLRKDEEFRKEVGDFTFEDILSELEKPGRDPREEFVPFQFRDDIHELKDLKPGMPCPGIVTNVTNFGAFVDIGVHQDGLVHLSQLSERYVKDPHEVVNPGDRVHVRVIEINLEKGQIALSMKPDPKEKRREASQKRARARARAPKPERERERPKPPRPQPSSDGIKLTPRDPNAPRPSKPQKHHAPKPRTPQPAFNNAFAGLAGLREQLKRK